MHKPLAIVATVVASAAGVAAASATTGGGGPGGCQYDKCPPTHTRPTTPTVTVTVPITTTITEPGTTITEPGTTITEPGTTTTVVQQGAPPTVVVTPGPTNQTVNITITINGVPQTITVPGSVPGSKPACKVTLASAKLGPLPVRFRRTHRVAVAIHGRNQIRTVLSGRRVSVTTAGLPCGTYPIVVNDFPNTRAIVPVLRIWTLTGGKGLQRAGFPDPVPPIGLS